MTMTAADSRRPVFLVALLILATVAVAAAVLLIAAPTADAGVDDSPWEATGFAALGDDYAVVSDGTGGTPAQFKYDCSTECIDVEVGGVRGLWEFSTQATATGTVDLDFSFAGEFDGSQNYYSIIAYVGNPYSNPEWSTDGTPADSFEVVGSSGPMMVNAGDEYGFFIEVSSYDGTVLSGELIVEGFAVEVYGPDELVPSGETVTVEVAFNSGGNGDAIDDIEVQLPDLVDYVAGSAEYDADNDGTTDFVPPEPIVDGAYGLVLWATDAGFNVDGSNGGTLYFDVALDVDYAYLTEYSDVIIDVMATAGSFEAFGTGAFGVTDPVPAQSGVVALQQAVPLDDGTKTGIVGWLVDNEATQGEPFTYEGTLEFFYDTYCYEGYLGEGGVPLGSFPLNATADNGELFFALAIDNDPGLGPINDGFITARYGVGDESYCIAIGPDNTSWDRALNIPPGATDGVVDQPGQSRWYKFAIQPGATARVTLENLPVDYDIAVFKDIEQAYTDLTDDPVEDLHRLSAEFAPSVFSPSVFSPSVFSPSVFSPDAYSPSAISPSVFSPSVFSPSVFSPSVFSPSVFSPSVFSPSVFSPSVFSPSVFSGADFSPSVFSPSVFSPDEFNPSVFSPDAYASAQSRSIIGVSANTGIGNELVIANTWTNTGNYYIRVVGKNGVFDLNNQFRVDVALEGASCSLGGLSLPGSRTPVAGADQQSVILWDRDVIEGTETEKDSLAAKLDELAVATDGVVLNLADDAEVVSLRSQAGADADCVYKTNLLAESIKNLADSYRNSDSSYVVLVGGDDSVPFFRYPDQGLLGPESDYYPPVADESASQAALRLNYILGQDGYGSRISISAGDGSIPIPDLAVGRVVETATEAVGVIDAYLSNPVLSPTTSLTTGYDFLTDAADAVAGTFDLGLANSSPSDRDELIQPADDAPEESWTADDLRDALLTERHDLIYLAGHFSANSSLAADYATSVITTELAASPIDLENALVFSGGCHSGYNIVNGEIVPGVTLDLDWAQAFAQKRATLVAGTGYQYGDTDFIEYSERLYADFAEQFRYGTGAVAVGEALVDAKQLYLQNTPDMRGLHRKALIIATVFGLPMAGVDLPTGRLPAPSEASTVATSTFTDGPGFFLGLEFADKNVAGAATRRNITLEVLPDQVSDILATYYVGPDGVVTNPAEPAIPLVSENVAVDGQVLRGVGFRGGSYSDTPGIVPLTGAPTTELRGVHTPFASQVFFPMRLATVNYFGELSDDGGVTRLNVTPAQHRVQTIGDTEATLRLFSNVDLRLYYSNNTETYDGVVPALSAPPTITQVSANIVNTNDVEFEVFVVGDPVAGIQEVWITYTDETAGSPLLWQSLDLVQDPNDSTRWTGVLVGGAAFGALDFVAQAASGIGLIAFDDNYGEYFQIGSGNQSTFPDPTSIVVTGPASGTFGSDVTVSATLISDSVALAGETVIFSVGGSTRVGTTTASGVAQAILPLNAVPDGYDLTASFAGSDDFEPSSDEAQLTINKAPTSIAISLGTNPVAPGDSTGLYATLTGPSGGPLNERAVFFTVTDGVNTQVVHTITTIAGVANLGVLGLPPGTYDVTAQFAGNDPFPAGADETYLASSVTEIDAVEIEGDAQDNDGDGIPDDLDDDDDNDGITDDVEITIGTDPLVPNVGRQWIQAIRDYLSGLEGERKEEQRLDKAVKSLDKALEAQYWVSDDSLDLDKGDKAFKESRKAVKELMKIDDGLKPSARTAIDVLVFAHRQLAQLAVDEAIAIGGDDDDIDEALEHLDKGDAYDAAHRWDKAVQEYRKAWEEAADVLEDDDGDDDD